MTAVHNSGASVRGLSVCSACRINLGIYSGGKPPTCVTCGNTYCSSCYSLKLKLDSGSGNTSGACVSCQQLLVIKQGKRPQSPTVANPTKINCENKPPELPKSAPPTKPARSYTNINKPAECPDIPLSSYDSELRHRRPGDNRRFENIIDDVTRHTLKPTGDPWSHSETNVSSSQKLYDKPSTDRPSNDTSTFSGTLNGNSHETDQNLEQNYDSYRNQPDCHLHDKDDSYEKGHSCHTKYPDSHLQDKDDFHESENTGHTKYPDMHIQGNDDFHESEHTGHTKYPDRHLQDKDDFHESEHTGHSKYPDRHLQDNDDFHESEHTGHSKYPDRHLQDNDGFYENEIFDHTKLPLRHEQQRSQTDVPHSMHYPQRNVHGSYKEDVDSLGEVETRGRHRGRYQRRNNMPYYEDPAYDPADFDDEVPPLDEIPYALIMTGDVDDKMLQKAIRAQQQKDELLLIQKANEKVKCITTESKEYSNKNKNMAMSKKSQPLHKDDPAKEKQHTYTCSTRSSQEPEGQHDYKRPLYPNNARESTQPKYLEHSTGMQDSGQIQNEPINKRETPFENTNEESEKKTDKNEHDESSMIRQKRLEKFNVPLTNKPKDAFTPKETPLSNSILPTKSTHQREIKETNISNKHAPGKPSFNQKDICSPIRNCSTTPQATKYDSKTVPFNKKDNIKEVVGNTHNPATNDKVHKNTNDESSDSDITEDDIPYIMRQAGVKPKVKKRLTTTKSTDSIESKKLTSDQTKAAKDNIVKNVASMLLNTYLDELGSKRDDDEDLPMAPSYTPEPKQIEKGTATSSRSNKNAVNQKGRDKNVSPSTNEMAKWGQRERVTSGGNSKKGSDMQLDVFTQLFGHTNDKNTVGSDKSVDGGSIAEKSMGSLLLFFLTSSADSRHRAFKRVKNAKFDGDPKCTTCGRPECNGYNMMKMKGMLNAAKDAGFEVRDVVPDGNCMFAAVVDQLHLHGDYTYGPKSLREAAVTWLIENPYSDDGTHYESFLEESWDVYVQRMMGEGQWGDHIILRAMVEVLGHTITVLNASATDAPFTKLEPKVIQKDKDDKPLVLGHVGEFHYTSLRPVEQQTRSYIEAPMSPEIESPSIKGESGQMKLEGSETVEMFREDYIDGWSDIPVAHLSYLLKKIIPITCIDEAAIAFSQMSEPIETKTTTMPNEFGGQADCSCETYGSVAEMVFVPKLNPKILEDSSSYNWVDRSSLSIRKDIRVVEQSSTAQGPNIYKIDILGVHPGYTKLITLQVYGGSKLLTAYVQKPTLNVRSPKDKMSMTKQLGNMMFMEQTVKPAAECRFWPAIADEWKTRTRREGWPSEETIVSVISEGCLIAAVAHPDSKQPDLEWEFNFALVERKLFREDLSPNQKYGYILFKVMCEQTLKELETIKPEHLKSVFLYACERVPAEYWSSSPGSCVLYMLDELLRYTREKNLPNYFIPMNNMVDYMTDKDLDAIESQIILLRSQPLLFLRQIHESAKYLYKGNTVIEDVSDDIVSFRVHKSVQQSTLQTFVPTTIKIAQSFITVGQYKQGYEILSQAYEERLSVSTCDDSVPFQLFLNGAISGIDRNSLVWFSAFTDKQLGDQLSSSLVKELCTDLPLVKINTILPTDVAGSFAETEVPEEYAVDVLSFCNDFAHFLFQIEKTSEVLAVLFYGRDHYNRVLQAQPQPVTDNEVSDAHYHDCMMIEIYAGCFWIYGSMGQDQFFRDLLPEIRQLCQRINTQPAYRWLRELYVHVHDFEGVKSLQDVQCKLEDHVMEYRYRRAIYWKNPKQWKY